jgi:hypothetical protein
LRKIRSYEECHRIINGVIEKQCSICEKWFLETQDNFYHSNKTNVLFPYCKKCASEKSFEWEKAHPERKKELIKKYESNPKRQEMHRVDAKRRRDQGLCREWQRNNMDKCVEYIKLKFQEFDLH